MRTAQAKKDPLCRKITVYNAGRLLEPRNQVSEAGEFLRRRAGIKRQINDMRHHALRLNGSGAAQGGGYGVEA